TMVAAQERDIRVRCVKKRIAGFSTKASSAPITSGLINSRPNQIAAANKIASTESIQFRNG
ncbi:MAG: hypothetical protein MUO62_14345, partial [Anaerolineales bacterium]|nr:hypothetical protein [Anaerolineales bacterium]